MWFNHGSATNGLPASEEINQLPFEGLGNMKGPTIYMSDTEESMIPKTELLCSCPCILNFEYSIPADLSSVWADIVREKLEVGRRAK